MDRGGGIEELQHCIDIIQGQEERIPETWTLQKPKLVSIVFLLSPGCSFFADYMVVLSFLKGRLKRFLHICCDFECFPCGFNILRIWGTCTGYAFQFLLDFDSIGDFRWPLGNVQCL